MTPETAQQQDSEALDQLELDIAAWCNRAIRDLEAIAIQVSKYSLPYSKEAEEFLQKHDFVMFGYMPDEGEAHDPTETHSIVALKDGLVVELYK